MIKYPSAIEIIKFTGAKALSGTVKNTALSSQGSPDAPLARITSDAHGLLANSKIFLQGLTGYDSGIYDIVAVATNTFDIKTKKYTALTPAGTEPWGVWAQLNEPFWFVGFKMHLNAADASGEDLTLTVDADFGAAFDVNILTQNMIGVQDVIYFPSVPVLLQGDDILKFAWTNTGAKTWGIDLHIARVR